MAPIRKEYPPIEILHKLFRHDDMTGLLYRRGKSKPLIAKTMRGYTNVQIDKERFYAHKIIFAMYNGYYPEYVDHDDRNNFNNRSENLKDRTQSENMHNMHLPIHNSSGYHGVSWESQRQKWRAQGKFNGVYHNFGNFDTIEEAISARKAGELHYLGKHQR